MDTREGSIWQQCEALGDGSPCARKSQRAWRMPSAFVPWLKTLRAVQVLSLPPGPAFFARRALNSGSDGDSKRCLVSGTVASGVAAAAAAHMCCCGERPNLHPACSHALTFELSVGRKYEGGIDPRNKTGAGRT